MTVLPNGVEIQEDEEWFWELCGYTCVAHPHVYAVAIHHEPPRSLNPNWETDYASWFLVCAECHNKVHRLGRKDAGYFLYHARATYYPKLERKLDFVTTIRRIQGRDGL